MALTNSSGFGRGSAGEVLTSNGAGADPSFQPGSGGIITGKNGFYYFEDFIVPTRVSMELQNGFHLSYAGLNGQTGLGTTLVDPDHPGVCYHSISSGGPPTRFASTCLGNYRSLDRLEMGFVLGGGKYVLESMMQIDLISTSTKRFRVSMQIGDELGNIITGANPLNNGIFIEYSDNINSGRFNCRCMSGGVSTSLDSGVTMAINTWYKLRFVVNAAATSVEFFIDDVSVGTITTNIPTSTIVNMSTGIASDGPFPSVLPFPHVFLDYIETFYILTNPR